MPSPPEMRTARSWSTWFGGEQLLGDLRHYGGNGASRFGDHSAVEEPRTVVKHQIIRAKEGVSADLGDSLLSAQGD